MSNSNQYRGKSATNFVLNVKIYPPIMIVPFGLVVGIPGSYPAPMGRCLKMFILTAFLFGLMVRITIFYLDGAQFDFHTKVPHLYFLHD